MKKQSEGDALQIKIAASVRLGARTYLNQQYKVVALVFAVVFGLLLLLAFGLRAQTPVAPFAFLTGGLVSGLTGFLGMKTATYANSRTATAARQSLNAALQVAFRSGAVMGLNVVGFGLLAICLWFYGLYTLTDWGIHTLTVALLAFSFGASLQALFARVGGGIFTKAADVGADLVGKIEAGIPEDDPRNPATIADNVGDNVGDVAGMGADLYESFCSAILAAAALGAAAFVAESADKALRAAVLPMVIAGLGTVMSIVGIRVVRTCEQVSQKVLLRALGRGVNLSSLLIIGASYFVVRALLPDHRRRVLVARERAGRGHGDREVGGVLHRRGVSTDAIHRPPVEDRCRNGDHWRHGDRLSFDLDSRVGDLPGDHDRVWRGRWFHSSRMGLVRRRRGGRRNALDAGDHAGHGRLRPDCRQCRRQCRDESSAAAGARAH